MEFFNSLNLKQIKGGTKLKQGDLGSVLSYSLTDENGQEITSFDNKTAYINLVLDDKIWFTTTTLVDISRVTFRIDKAIPIGLYYLEIKIDDYIFPSDRDSIILIEKGSTPYDLKELVPNYDTNMTIKGILSDLRQKGIDISDLNRRIENANAELIASRNGKSNLKTRIDDLENKTTAQLAEKANKDEVTNVMTPKGNIAYASLPMTGNSVGWYYYCPDGDGTHGAGNYVWNGTSWFFGGTGDEGYNLLKKDIVDKASGQIKGLLVKDSYVDRDGTFSDYVGWSRTDYIDVSQYSVLGLNTPVEIRYGVWLKEDKTTVVFPIVTTTKGEIELFVPLDAKYLVLSNPTANMEKTTISVKRRKSDNLDFDGKRININYIVNGYLMNGNLHKGDRWVATDYIEIPKNLYIVSDGTEEDNAYNAFYDENKVYISSFNTKGKYIKVPDNAKYMRLSTLNSNEQRVYARNPLLLKVGSFNVGMWTDGVGSNARVDPANVKEESIKLRRFIGNTNFDFLFCEEATHEFDKDYKIDAYEYCFKNNLPFYWKTKSSAEGSPQVRQFLLTGKYELINVTYHDYECESTRGYVTFECNISGRNITFVVCHLSLESSSDGIRQKEMEELANILKKCEYGVLCGDFNAFSIDEFTTHFSEFNLSNHGYYGDFNTWPVPGWKSWNHCLDNIITTKSIKITNVLMGEIAMSDHKPLIAEVEIL